VVFEKHRDVAGPRIIDRLKAAPQKVRPSHRLVTIVPVGPTALTVEQKRAFRELGVVGASFNLSSNKERRIYLDWCRHRLGLPWTGSSQSPSTE
jgi:hypothetical protein